MGEPGFPLLTLFTFVPALGMIVVLLLPTKRDEIVKTVAAAAAAVPALLGLYVLFFFRDTGAVQYRETFLWISGLNIYYGLGMDGLSAPMVVLSGLVGFVAVIASWGIEKQVKGYFALILLLLTGMNGVFCALDFFLFYVFWELMLLPMYFLIGIWGGPQRVYAAIKFFLYTMAGSVLMLVVLLACWYWSDGTYADAAARNRVKATVLERRAAAALEWEQAAKTGFLTPHQERAILDRYGIFARQDPEGLLAASRKLQSRLAAETALYEGEPKGLERARAAVLERVTLERTFDLIELRARHELFLNSFRLFQFLRPFTFASLMFVFLFVAFAIKVPIFPFHTWLPWAHVEAPTAISVILAGILLKMGVYGFFRLSYSLFPTAGVAFAVPMAALGVFNILYGACCAMAQDDMKKLVAYSSVSHMGFCILGLAALTNWGMTGSVLQMFNHGTSTSMMFILVGVIYDRAHHRDIGGFGGLAQQMPRYAGITSLALFASMGLPGLSGFIGEALVFLGSFRSPLGGITGARPHWSFQTLTVIAALGVVLTAGYLLWMLQRMFFGPLNEKYKTLPDLSGREALSLAPLAVLVVVFGVYPQPLINLTEPSVARLQAFVTATNPELRKMEKTAVAEGARPADGASIAGRPRGGAEPARVSDQPGGPAAPRANAEGPSGPAAAKARTGGVADPARPVRGG